MAFTRVKFALPTLALGAALTTLASPAHAAHHQWIITEVYSNADGTVQFVELKGTANNEQNLNGFTVNTFGATPTSAPTGPNLGTASTAGLYLLFGTAGYQTRAAAQGAPAPDRVLPDHFLELTGDTVRYAGIAATDRIYTAAQLPTGGIDSLDFENTMGTVNTPQNLAGATGSIDATPAAAPVPAATRYSVVGLIGAVIVTIGVLLRRRALVLGGS